ILSKLGAVLDKTEQYKQLLSCDGPDAQTILDVFQMLLDTRDLQGRLRRQLITAMRRLSATTKLYPQSFDLDGTTIVLAEQGPLKSGSYADIHKAHFQGQALCLKVIRTYTTSSPEYMAKIYAREAILWGQLSHPNLLPLYGLFTLRSQLSFVSPWAENGHLTEYLRANPAANRVLLCSDAAAGVSYLHGHTIVHGDLKAANVLVDASGRARLADFGLSSVTDPEIPHWATHSSVASKGGTTRWQAPELLAPESDDAIHNTEKSDVFAWACLAYEVFTGYVPFFESARESSVILRIGRGDLPTCPGDATYPWVDNGLTTEMWNLMEYCWTFTPADRPAIAEVLVRLELEKPTDTRPPAHWHGRSAARFRTSRDARVHQHCPSLEDLDAILSRMGGSS
ncbi:kinase-like domain-containing protein, partial [Lyophyllum atratum]